MITGVRHRAWLHFDFGSASGDAVYPGMEREKKKAISHLCSITKVMMYAILELVYHAIENNILLLTILDETFWCTTYLITF